MRLKEVKCCSFKTLEISFSNYEIKNKNCNKLQKKMKKREKGTETLLRSGDMTLDFIQVTT